MGEYTDAIERINIELSIENKLELLAELDAHLATPFALGKTDDAELDRMPRDEVVGDRVEQATELLAYTRARWSYLLTHLDTPLAEALPELSRLGLTHLTSEFDRRAPHGACRACSTCCRTTRSACRGRPKCGRRWNGSSPARRSRPCSPSARRSTGACCAGGCSSRCTCTPATATCTPTSRSTPTTTRCCSGRTRRSRASCRSRATSTA